MINPSPVKLSCIIDDDDIYVNLVTRIINTKNLSKNLIVFKNGKEALLYFKSVLENIEASSFPEIILLDLNMPIMDGWNFLTEFTQIKSPLKSKSTLYIVSSSINPQDIEKSKQFSDVADFLIKPIDINTFETIFKKNKISA